MVDVSKYLNSSEVLVGKNLHCNGNYNEIVFFCVKRKVIRESCNFECASLRNMWKKISTNRSMTGKTTNLQLCQKTVASWLQNANLVATGFDTDLLSKNMCFLTYECSEMVIDELNNPLFNFFLYIF